MKYWKKFASIALALVMVLALAVPAFAGPAPTYSITIEQDSQGHTYEAYQIFTGTISYEYEDASGVTHTDSQEPASGTAYRKVLSNVAWGSGIDQTKISSLISEFGLPTGATAADLANELGTAAWMATGKPEEAADILSKYLSNTTAGTTNSQNANGDYVISGLLAGYYLIKDKDGTQTNVQDGSYTDYIMQVLGNVTKAAKDGVPTPDKKILDSDGKPKVVGDYSIGDVVNFELTATLPNNYEAFKEYKLVFKDTMSKGLKLDESSIKVYAGADSSPISNNAYQLDTVPNQDGSTDITVTFANLKLNEATNQLISNQTIKITYSAELTEQAAVGITGEPNKMKLEYSNDPNYSSTSGGGDTPTGVTPEVEVRVYTTGIKLTKVAEDGTTPLTGAQFQIKGTKINTLLVNGSAFVESDTGTYYKLLNGTYTETAPTADTEDLYESTTQKYAKTTVSNTEETTTVVEATAFVDSNGVLTFDGLAAGTYTITELTAPTGYNKLEKPFEVTIGFVEPEKGSTNCTWTVSTKVDGDEVEGWSLDGNGIVISSIMNQKGTTLPETGGIGTTIFYIVGGVLLIGAVVLLIAKRRTSVDDE